MYDWYLALGPLSNINAKFAHGKLPSWNEVVEHPTHDVLARRSRFVPSLDRR